MLLPSNSLLSAVKAKTAQVPRKGTKALVQKSGKKMQQSAKQTSQKSTHLTAKASTQSLKKVTPKVSAQNQKVQTSKSAPVNDQQLREQDAIIRAAEQYHQQITGRKTEKAVEKKARPDYKSNSVKAVEVQSDGSERDLGVNIYTGNPGIYQADGDTLNFWSLTPVPVDSTVVLKITVEQPGKPYGFDGKPIKSMEQDWTFFLILIGWTIFASLQFGFSKYILQVFQSVVNYGASSRLYRERGYSNNFGVFRLNVIFFLFLPFPFYLIARDNGMTVGSSGIEFFLIVFAVVNAYFMLKIFIYKMLGSIFSQREATGELIFNMMLYHNVLGLILLPVATIHLLVPGFGIISMFLVPALVVIFYLMSIFRSIYFAIREGISIFYLILYLCALEILPFLLVGKLAAGA
ncbi:MAG: DUF4271 domain-containing protein [Prolixibacteraceae bacterium]|jgi:hypothetical protein|nr:DUF4271 domain-containing protein [Prolixibacteraceae bacterium]